MTDEKPEPRPALSAAEIVALTEARARPVVAAYTPMGRMVAYALRQDFPEFDDVTLGRMALHFAAYLQVTDEECPGLVVTDMTAVLSAAAIELTTLETL